MYTNNKSIPVLSQRKRTAIIGVPPPKELSHSQVLPNAFHDDTSGQILPDIHPPEFFQDLLFKHSDTDIPLFNTKVMRVSTRVEWNLSNYTLTESEVDSLPLFNLVHYNLKTKSTPLGVSSTADSRANTSNAFYHAYSLLTNYSLSKEDTIVTERALADSSRAIVAVDKRHTSIKEVCPQLFPPLSYGTNADLRYGPFDLTIPSFHQMLCHGIARNQPIAILVRFADSDRDTWSLFSAYPSNATKDNFIFMLSEGGYFNPLFIAAPLVTMDRLPSTKSANPKKVIIDSSSFNQPPSSDTEEEDNCIDNDYPPPPPPSPSVESSNWDDFDPEDELDCPDSPSTRATLPNSSWPQIDPNSTSVVHEVGDLTLPDPKLPIPNHEIVRVIVGDNMDITYTQGYRRNEVRIYDDSVRYSTSYSSVFHQLAKFPLYVTHAFDKDSKTFREIAKFASFKNLDAQLYLANLTQALLRSVDCLKPTDFFIQCSDSSCQSCLSCTLAIPMASVSMISEYYDDKCKPDKYQLAIPFSPEELTYIHFVRNCRLAIVDEIFNQLTPIELYLYIIKAISFYKEALEQGRIHPYLEMLARSKIETTDDLHDLTPVDQALYDRVYSQSRLDLFLSNPRLHFKMMGIRIKKEFFYAKLHLKNTTDQVSTILREWVKKIYSHVVALSGRILIPGLFHTTVAYDVCLNKLRAMNSRLHLAFHDFVLLFKTSPDLAPEIEMVSVVDTKKADKEVFANIFDEDSPLESFQSVAQELLEEQKETSPPSCSSRTASAVSSLIVSTLTNIRHAFRQIVGSAVVEHAKSLISDYLAAFSDAMYLIKKRTKVDLIKLAHYILVFKLCYDYRSSKLVVGLILASQANVICKDLVHVVMKIFRYFFNDDNAQVLPLQQELGYDIADAFTDTFKVLTGNTVPNGIADKCAKYLRLFITAVAAGKGVMVLMMAVTELVASPISYLINTYKFNNNPALYHLRGNITDAYKLADVELITADQAFVVTAVYSHLMTFTAAYRLDKERNYATKAASEAASHLRVKYLQAVNFLHSSEQHTQPIGVYIFGEPGCGKSTAVPRIMDYMWSGFHDSPTLNNEPRFKNRDRPNNEVINMTNDPYNDSYQPCVFAVYDDPVNTTDKRDNTKVLSNFINMINTAPYPLQVATPELKGKVYMRSKVLLVTSNVRLLPGAFNLNDMGAIYRRFTITARMSFKNPGSRTGRQFEVGKEVYVNSNDSKTVTTDFVVERTLTEEEFGNYCYTIAKHHESLFSPHTPAHPTTAGYKVVDFNDDEQSYLALFYDTNKDHFRFNRLGDDGSIASHPEDTFTLFPQNAGIASKRPSPMKIKDVFDTNTADEVFKDNAIRFEGALKKATYWDRVQLNLKFFNSTVLWYGLICASASLAAFTLFRYHYGKDYAIYLEIRQESFNGESYPSDEPPSTTDTENSFRNLSGYYSKREEAHKNSQYSNASSYRSNDNQSQRSDDSSKSWAQESLIPSEIEKKIKRNSVVVTLNGLATSPHRQWLFVNDHTLVFAAHEISCLDVIYSITIGSLEYKLKDCKYATLAQPIDEFGKQFEGQHFGVLSLPRPHPSISNIMSALLPDELSRTTDNFLHPLYRYRPSTSNATGIEFVPSAKPSRAFESEGLSLGIFSQVGMCGAVYYSTIPNHLGNYIYGIHTHGTGTSSFATKLTARDILATLDFMAQRGNNLNNPYIPSSLGVISGKPSLSKHKANIVPSPLYSVLIPPTKVPIDTNSPKVHQESLKCVSTNLSVVNEDILNKAVSHFIQTNPYSKVGTLSTFEAINGVPGSIDAMNVKTSLGDCLGYTGNKEDVMEGPPNFRRLKPDVQSAFDSYQVDPSSFNWRSALKNETRSLTKVKDSLARLFFVGPFFLVLLGRQVLSLLQKEFSKHCHTGTISIGINPFNSNHWTTLGNRFGKSKVLAGDKKSFDMHIPVSFLYATSRIIKHYLHEPSHYFVDFYLSELLLGTHIINGVKYYKLGGNCSGGPSTAFFNSVVNALMNYYCVLLCIPENEPLTSIDMATFGDDDIISVPSHLEEYLTYDRMISAFKTIGVTYTTFDKKSKADTNNNSISEVQYLKRFFAVTPHRTFKAPRSLEDIYQQINFMNKDSAKEIGIEAYMYQVTQAVVLEMTQHSRSNYNRVLNILQSKLTQCFGSRWTYPEYDDALHIYCGSDTLGIRSIPSLNIPEMEMVDRGILVQESELPSTTSEDYIPTEVGAGYPHDYNILSTLPIRVGSFTYSSSSANLLYLARLSDLLVNHPISKILNNYGGWKSKFKLTFKLASSPIVGGYLFASYLPEIDITNSSPASHMAAALYNSNQYLFSTSNSDVEFPLMVTQPYERNWSTHLASENFGTIMVHAPTPLSGSVTGSEQVTVSIYLTLYDTILVDRFIQESSTDTSVIDLETKVKSETGIVSSLIKGTGHILGKIPFRPAQFLSSIASPLGSVIEMLGFQQPNDQRAPEKSLIYTSSGMSNSRGLYSCESFALSMATTQVVDPTLIHSGGQHTLSSLASIPGLLSTFSISPVSTGRIFERTMNYGWMSYQVGEYHYPSPLQFVLSNASRYYTDLNLELVISCSPMVSAEILIVHTKYFVGAVNYSTKPDNVNSRTYKIQGNTRIRVRLPWLGHKSRAAVGAIGDDTNGYLSVFVISPPIALSDSVDPTIHCAVLVAAADNLILCMQTKSELDPHWIQESDTNLHTTFANPSNFEYLRPVPAQLGSIVEGEAIESINDVLLRFPEPQALIFNGSATKIKAEHTILRAFSRHRNGYRAVIYTMDENPTIKALTTMSGSNRPSGCVLWDPKVSSTLSLFFLRQSNNVYDIKTPWTSSSKAPPTDQLLLFSPTPGNIMGTITISDDSIFSNTIFPGRYKRTYELIN